MKRIMSFLLLLAILFLTVEFLVTLFTKEYKISYTIYSNKKEIKVSENYAKKYDNVYDVEINIEDNTFYYLINNNFNKQKRIIKDIVYYEDNGNICIYPILKDDSGTYIECLSDSNLYTKDTFPNRNLVNKISNDLDSRGYRLDYNDNATNKFENSTIYQNNIKDGDKVIVWNYKNISISSSKETKGVRTSSFDKYNNKLGILVGKYYVVPNYTNEKIFEFNELLVINIENYSTDTIKLKDITLSSSTYLNGIVNDKIYYTDASNLVQIEVNVKGKSSRLIGNTTLGGQMYDGEKWSNRNIYDFKQEIKYESTQKELENISYSNITTGKGVYYILDKGNVYQVLKNHKDKKILIFNTNSINNFQAVGNDLYYVIGDTLYYYSNDKGIIKLVTNKDLLYNTNNRISVYRKGS